MVFSPTLLNQKLKLSIYLRKRSRSQQRTNKKVIMRCQLVEKRKDIDNKLSMTLNVNL